MESESDVGVGVTLEVRLHRFKKVKMAVEKREKMAGYVRRGEEYESDVDVGVPLEVRLYRF